MNHNLRNKIFDKFAIIQWKDKIKELNKEYHETFMEECEYFQEQVWDESLHKFINSYGTIIFRNKDGGSACGSIGCLNGRVLSSSYYNPSYCSINNMFDFFCGNVGDELRVNIRKKQKNIKVSHNNLSKYYFYSSGMNEKYGYKTNVNGY